MIRDELYLEVRSMIGRTTPTGWLDGDWAEGSVDEQQGAMPVGGNGGPLRRGMTAAEQAVFRWLLVVIAVGLLTAVGGQVAGPVVLGVALSAGASVLLAAAVAGNLVLIVRMRRRARRIDRLRRGGWQGDGDPS